MLQRKKRKKKKQTQKQNSSWTPSQPKKHEVLPDAVKLEQFSAQQELNTNINRILHLMEYPCWNIHSSGIPYFFFSSTFFPLWCKGFLQHQLAQCWGLSCTFLFSCLHFWQPSTCTWHNGCCTTLRFFLEASGTREPVCIFSPGSQLCSHLWQQD